MNPNSAQKSSASLVRSTELLRAWILAILFVALPIDEVGAAAGGPLLVPPWANKTVLEGSGSLQSNSNSGASNRAGFVATITPELKHSPALQVTWGVQARDIGQGLNVNGWNPYLELRSLTSESSSVVATIPLNISGFLNLDGSTVTTQQIGSVTTFLSPVDYGVSFTGRTNFVISYILSGQKLDDLQSSLQLGQEMALFLIADSIAEDGTSYTLGGPNVLANGGRSPAASLTGKNTSALPFLLPTTTALAFDIQPLPLPTPKLSVELLSASAQLSMSDLFPGRSYRVMESGSLTGWTVAHAFTSPTSPPPASPIDPVSITWTTSIHPSGKRFFRLEWEQTTGVNAP